MFRLYGKVDSLNLPDRYNMFEIWHKVNLSRVMAKQSFSFSLTRCLTKVEESIVPEYIHFIVN